MRRLQTILLLVAWLIATYWPLAAPASAAPARQDATPPARAAAKPVDVKPYLDKMTVADKVGQLFLVTFQGSDIGPESDIATLVRDYRVGGVVLLPGNDNFRNVPVPAPQITATPPVTATPTVTPTQSLLTTPLQIVRLTNALQALAMGRPRAITATTALTTTVPLTGTVAITGTRVITATPTRAATRVTLAPSPTPEAGGLSVPLLIALDWPGDDSSFLSGDGGFTPLPSAMAIGATWTPSLADRTGQALGRELRAVGVNLLLGPPLDVLDAPRPGGQGDLDTRSFGGDPFWVGQIGQAFIRGVLTGGGGDVVTAAKHFPGQGSSDRKPDEEVATVQKSVQQLRQIELAPFATITQGADLSAAGVTAALMTSHIRYRGFQGNIRQLTPPISLAPQLQDLLALKEFADWRAAGGVLVSDALGVPAVRRYYDPQLQKFPHRQVAQDAFLAGNDLLQLSRFALTDNWPDQFATIKETILFFQTKYRDDSEFRGRVDAAVTRILRLKLRVMGTNWTVNSLQRDASGLDKTVGQASSVTQAVARAGLTLIYPGREELSDRLPSAPLADENIVIFTDARAVRQCDACEPTPLIRPTALQEIMLRLYGPNATGQIAQGQVRSFTFSDLYRILNGLPNQELETAINAARWIIFAQLDYSPQEYPDSAALRTFLSRRSDSLRDKRLVVMAFRAPYYLDTTDISKLTAYFGVYGSTAPFLETAVRALFREFSPVGAPPVSVTGINYDLIKQLEPAPSQIIALGPASPAEVISGSIKVGSQIVLETGPILDRKGHPVPDGTPVEFQLRYPAESLVLAPKVETTVAGKARTTVLLDRPGELWITVRAGEAQDSARIVLKVGGDAPGSIATVLPSPTPTATSTVTPSPTQTATTAPTAAPTATPTPPPLPPPLVPRVTAPAFLYGLLGAVLSGGTALLARRRDIFTRRSAGARGAQPLEAALRAVAVAWVAYLLYAVGWLPGATKLQASGHTWAAAGITLIGGLLSAAWDFGTSRIGRRSVEGEGSDDLRPTP